MDIETYYTDNSLLTLPLADGELNLLKLKVQYKYCIQLECK